MLHRFRFVLSLLLIVSVGTYVVWLVLPNEDLKESALTPPKESILDEQAMVKVAQDYGKLPLHFEPNVGQTNEQVDFVTLMNN